MPAVSAASRDAGARPYLTLSLDDIDTLNSYQHRIVLRASLLHVLLDREQDLEFEEELEDLVNDVAAAAAAIADLLAHTKKAGA